MADYDANEKRSASRTRNSRPTTPMRPTTPLRPSSRSSFRESARDSVHGGGESFPLNTFEPAFAELSDAMADLEANMMHFQLMHESLARFSESFASFMYGLNMNAFCVDFQEGPVPESFKRAKLQEEMNTAAGSGIPRAFEKPSNDFEGETTFMTTDVSFVENPPAASKSTPKYKTPSTATGGSRVPAPATRGGTTRGRAGGRGGSETTRGRGTGIVRPRGRGVR
ncbi:DASH complex subunit Dam1-domain-containing protein [Colletotrichum phormii]|uniref:DASH complex subunit DAM1 n=1 Tax=Colletotrichum phormii TaxID=359342 RepID=A0AAI9ZTW0_9PEZI|nr:DASH complex subunit Dam1-domain-containing protein [Colletotrichum phormii]KAK1638112.1 DASH complex subunit Dam1-domain-containing protein [Colletotrichum phormii]